MFGRKTQTNNITITASPGFGLVFPPDVPKPIQDFLADLATLYPEIKRDLAAYSISRTYLARYRVHDVKIAADAIRAAENQKRADSLIKEFRGK